MQKFFVDILGSLMMVQDFYSKIHSPLLYLTQCFAFLQRLHFIEDLRLPQFENNPGSTLAKSLQISDMETLL